MAEQTIRDKLATERKDLKTEEIIGEILMAALRRRDIKEPLDRLIAVVFRAGSEEGQRSHKL